MITDDIKLPELPEPITEIWPTMPADEGEPSGVYDDKLMREYARAAILADRQRRAQAAEPVSLRSSKNGGPWPVIGEKYIVRLGGVLQEDIYEFDQGDDGMGGGPHFWSRDDVDECPSFNPESDEWLPLSAVGSAAPAEVTEAMVERAIPKLRELSQHATWSAGYHRVVKEALEAALGSGDA